MFFWPRTSNTCLGIENFWSGHSAMLLPGNQSLRDTYDAMKNSISARKASKLMVLSHSNNKLQFGHVDHATSWVDVSLYPTEARVYSINVKHLIKILPPSRPICTSSGTGNQTFLVNVRKFTNRFPERCEILPYLHRVRHIPPLSYLRVRLHLSHVLFKILPSVLEKCE